MKILIGKQFGNLVLITIQAILTHFSESSAENITIEKIFDLTVFGACNIHIKRFCGDQSTLDLTETILLVQQKIRKDYALTTIDNATRLLPMVSPTVSVLERCVLNIIVGIVPNDVGRLAYFMYGNNYTYSSTPFSTYILIPHIFNAKGNLVHPILTMLVLPVRVFYLLVPSLQSEDLSLHTHPYVHVCAHCYTNSRERKFKVNSDLAYISSLNFSFTWMRNDVEILNLFLDGSDITGCEEVPWLDFTESYRDSKYNFCNDDFALMDVLVRSVSSNLTVSAKYYRDVSDNRFSGHLRSKYLSDPGFNHAASSWFLDFATGGIYFCDCNPKSQTEMLKAWVTPFGRSVWLCLMITFLLLILIIWVQLRILKVYNTDKGHIMDHVIPFVTVAGLFFRQEGTNVGNQRLLLLSSFCIGLILCLYENIVTSELVVPPPNFEHNLSSLLMADSTKVIYSGDESPTNPQLMELKIETNKWNITNSLGQLELNNKLHEEKPPLVNGTSLSYFVFFTPVEANLQLRRLQLVHNKCHCYIVRHAFRHRGIYINFELFLRNRFTSIANILRESGIHSFFAERYRKSAFNIHLAKLRSLLVDNKYHSDFFVREEIKMDVIKLENLYFVLVIFGGMGFLAVGVFTFKQMDWLTLWIHCERLLSNPLHAIPYV
jgi:hypothetical protein